MFDLQFFFLHALLPQKKICEACIKFLTMYRKLTKHKMTILSKMNTLGEVPEPIFPGDEIFLNMWIVATMVNVRSSSFWKLYRHTTFKSNQLEHNDTKKRIGIKHGSKFRIPHLGINSNRLLLIDQLYAYILIFSYGVHAGI